MGEQDYTPMDINWSAALLGENPRLEARITELASAYSIAKMPERIAHISKFYETCLNAVIAENKAPATVDLTTLLLAATREQKIYFADALRMIMGDQIRYAQKSGKPFDEEAVKLKSANFLNTLVMIYPGWEDIIKAAKFKLEEENPKCPMPPVARPFKGHSKE